VDREQARRNLISGLWLGLMAAGLFAITFIVATIYIAYVPQTSIVELKSLKLYINKYRNEYVFHEAAVNRILDDLVALVDPRWLEVIGDFTVRGNIHTVISVRKGPEGYKPPPKPKIE